MDLDVGEVVGHDRTDDGLLGHRAVALRRRRPLVAAGGRGRRVVVRDVITGELTDANDQDLIKASGREHLKEDILKALKKKTDVKVEEVLFSDLTVQ